MKLTLTSSPWDNELLFHFYEHFAAFQNRIYKKIPRRWFYRHEFFGTHLPDSVYTLRFPHSIGLRLREL